MPAAPKAAGIFYMSCNISRDGRSGICYTRGMDRKLIAYYRVSTKAQGDSGLGLEGQTAAVEAYAAREGAEILRAYQEVETGKRADRPELLKAIAHAKRSRATLVIAKLDRLARNVAFLANLMESGVDFVACDQPQANRLTIHILAAVAENEAVMISQRTKPPWPPTRPVAASLVPPAPIVGD